MPTCEMCVSVRHSLDRHTAPTTVARVVDRVARCMSILSGVLPAEDAGEFVIVRELDDVAALKCESDI
jgi:hypothetical protein